MGSEFENVSMRIHLQIDVVIGSAVRWRLLFCNYGERCDDEPFGREHSPCLFIQTRGPGFDMKD